MSAVLADIILQREQAQLMASSQTIGGLLAQLFQPSDELPRTFLDLLDRLETSAAPRAPAPGGLSDREFRQHLEQVLPQLRSFATSLTRDRDSADDLVQDTMMKAWKARDRYQPGTNFRAWLFVIARNNFLSDRRRARFKGDWDEIIASRLLAAPATQEHPIHLSDLDRAMAALAPTQREALMLVAVAGMSYDEAAEVMKVQVGTVKSRVSRARQVLEMTMGGQAIVTGWRGRQGRPSVACTVVT